MVILAQYSKQMRFLFILVMAMLASCSSKENQDEKKFINYGTPLSRIMEEKGLNRDKIRIEISKSEYTLFVKHGQEILKSYPVVLGPDPVNDKRMEGDGCTPEGIFGIRDKYPHRKWCRFIWLDYPNEDSWKKFNKAKADGKIPQDATIGGEVGIHGVPNGKDSWIEKGENWTLGCISLKNADIVELYDVITDDAKICIYK